MWIVINSVVFLKWATYGTLCNLPFTENSWYCSCLKIVMANGFRRQWHMRILKHLLFSLPRLLFLYPFFSTLLPVPAYEPTPSSSTTKSTVCFILKKKRQLTQFYHLSFHLLYHVQSRLSAITKNTYIIFEDPLSMDSSFRWKTKSKESLLTSTCARTLYNLYFSGFPPGT